MIHKVTQTTEGVLILSLILTVSQTVLASYTSQETDEKLKSVYSEVTSIHKSSDQSRHSRKHTYSPCANAACPLIFNNNPAFSTPFASGGYIDSSRQGYFQSNPQQLNHHYDSTPQTSMPFPSVGGYGANVQFSSGSERAPHIPAILEQPSQDTYSFDAYKGVMAPHAQWNNYPNEASRTVPNKNPTGLELSPPPSQTSFDIKSQGGIPATAWNPQYSRHSNHSPRGYSIYSHSFKTNSQYTESGTHTGSLQHPTSGNSYGSGPGFGYNGLFNRLHY